MIYDNIGSPALLISMGLLVIFLSGPFIAVFTGFRIFKMAPARPVAAKGAGRYLITEAVIVVALALLAAFSYSQLVTFNNDLKAAAVFGYVKKVDIKDLWTGSFYIGEEDKIIVLNDKLAILGTSEISLVDLSDGSISMRLAPPNDASFVVDRSPAPFLDAKRIYCAIKSTERGLTQAVAVDDSGQVESIDLAKYDEVRKYHKEPPKAEETVDYTINGKVFGRGVASTGDLNIVMMEYMQPNTIDILLNDGSWSIGDYSLTERVSGPERLYIIDAKSNEPLAYCELQYPAGMYGFARWRTSGERFIQSEKHIYIVKSYSETRETTVSELDLSKKSVLAF